MIDNIFLPIILVFIFILGTIIGSFLNVVILRFNSGRTVGGRSMCFSCGKQLKWHELVPLWSYVMQGGKCSVCKSKISLQYPVVELLTGLVFMLIALKFSFLLPLTPLAFFAKFAFYSYIFALLVVIGVYDVRHKIIPDDFSYLFSIMAFILLFFETGSGFVVHVPTLMQVLAGPFLALPFASLWYFSKGKWMGFGDAKLALGMGFLLGLSSGIAALLIAFWSGSIVAVILLLIKKYKLTIKSEIPFGPFLILGTFIAFYFGLSWFMIYL